MPNSDERLLCNSCGNWTWHNLIFDQRSQFPLIGDETGEEFGAEEDHWQVFRCKGCDGLTLRETEDFPWEPGRVVTYFPERRRTKRPTKQYQKLPPTLTRLYGEIVEAFNRQSFILCAGGLRALIEGVCQDQSIRAGENAGGERSRSLEARINGLSAVVPSGIVRNLHGFRFLGNRALHELEPPTKEDLELALTVVEDVLNVVYDLNYRAEQLLKATTHRKTRAAKN